VGLGLWKSSAESGVFEAVQTALIVGYTLLDGAAAYGNEKEVGSALAKSIADGVVNREDVFVVSKVFQTHHVWKGDPSRVHTAINQTLADLQVDYLDLYLMHWPFAFEQTECKSIGGLRLADGTPNPKLIWEMEYLDTWKEMCKLVEQGKVKAIGCSNFTEKQLQDILDGDSGVCPAVNQVELHPYLAQPSLTKFCKEKGIVMMGYSPLGSGDSYSGKSFPGAGTGAFETPSGGTTLLQNTVVNAIATKLGKSPGQILIKWSVQSGFVSIPKSTRAERIKQNADVFSWSIPDEDMADLAALNCDFRYGIGYCPGHYDCPNAPWFK